MAITVYPIPYRDPINQGGKITRYWNDWFTWLGETVGGVDTRIITNTTNIATNTAALATAPKLITSVNLTAQSASIAATDFSGGALTGGLYRISYYVRVTTVDTTSLSITVTFDWTDTTNPTWSGAAITGNTTTTTQQDSFLIRADAASAINYSTTVTPGTGDGRYSLDVTLESVDV